MSFDIDAAAKITNGLRYIRDSDDWDDQIRDITERAVKAAIGTMIPMRATGSSVADAWHMLPDDTDSFDGLLVITATWLLPPDRGSR